VLSSETFVVVIIDTKVSIVLASWKKEIWRKQFAISIGIEYSTPLAYSLIQRIHSDCSLL
jgi:hypothetical protein